MMNDEKFYEGVKNIVLFKSSEGGYVTLEDYWTRNKEKNGGKVFYAPDIESGSVYMDLFKEQGLEALFADSKIDTHFLQFLETKNSEMHFQRVDSDLVEQIVDKDKTEIVDADNKTDSDKLKEIFTSAIGRNGLEIKAENLKSATVPAVIMLPEHIRRLTEMNLGIQQSKSNLLQNHTLILNTQSELLKNLLKIHSGVNPDKTKEIVQHVYDLAKISAKIMDETEMGAFIKRSFGVLETLSR